MADYLETVVRECVKEWHSTKFILEEVDPRPSFYRSVVFEIPLNLSARPGTKLVFYHGCVTTGGENNDRITHDQYVHVTAYATSGEELWRLDAGDMKLLNPMLKLKKALAG